LLKSALLTDTFVIVTCRMQLDW